MADDEKESEDTKESLQEQSENLRQQIEEGEKLQFSIGENIARLQAMPQNGPRATVIQKTLKDFEAQYDDVEKQLNELRAEFDMIETRLDNREYVGGDAEADEEDEGGEGAFIGEGPVARSMQEHVDAYSNLGSDGAAGGGGGGGGAALPNFYLAAEQAEDAAPYVNSPLKKRHRTENNASAAPPAAAAAAAASEPSDPAPSSAARGKGKSHAHHPFALIARRRQMSGQSAPIFQRLDPAFFIKQPGCDSDSSSNSDSESGKMRGGANSIYHQDAEVFIHFSPDGNPLKLTKGRDIWLSRYPEIGGTGHRRGKIYAHFFKLRRNAKLFLLAGADGKYTKQVHEEIHTLIKELPFKTEAHKASLWKQYEEFMYPMLGNPANGGSIWEQGAEEDEDLVDFMGGILEPHGYDGFVRDVNRYTTEIVLFDQTILREIDKPPEFVLPQRAQPKLLSAVVEGAPAAAAQAAAGGGPVQAAQAAAGGGPAAAQAAAGGGPAV